MAEVNSVIKIGQTEFCRQKYETPSNGLWRFSPEQTNQGETQLFLSSEEPDLNLGLSLNGLYARSSKEKNLIRSSSSVAGFLAQDRVLGYSTHRQEGSFLSLSRSCSLPAETNETAIKLRDLQTMRRMAAKKRLVEKQRNCREALDEDKPPLAPAPAPETAAWAAASAAKSAALSRAISKIKTQGYVSSNYRQLEGHEFLTSARDSTESNSRHEQRYAVEPPMVASSEEVTGDRSVESSDNEPKHSPLKKLKVSNGIKAMDNWMDVMNRMPSVTTTGDGPNGRRIEGFLYKYTKGQVSIVCVCHGSFLSPAEFVRHAGGKEVVNPMKHIHVCTAYRL
ncbi:ninja-family protein AFP3-like [Humulus lupulus]|uniref:ninja-family protein AFP3-like n=1 Tax=Humulus lupulus TaxID=3486 RepID=UPI002B414CEB|nr:ninja-family protein AFP3-like [Humulus lupulus]XP_062116720.1 ninja-family protein AFP3-like [Humulus lupulus]